MQVNFLCRMQLVLCAGLLVSNSFADEPKDLDKIPKAVMDSLKTRFPKAKIVKWTKEKEDDKEVYDIEFTQESKKFEADIFSDGTIHNWEHEVAVKDLPKEVMNTVEKKYPKATIKEVMEIMEMKDKKEVHGGFEIVLESDKKEIELTIAKDGKILEDSTDKK